MLAIAPHVGVFQFAFLKAAQELGCFYTKGRVLRTRVFEITYQRKAQSVLDADPTLLRGETKSCAGCDGWLCSIRSG